MLVDILIITWIIGNVFDYQGLLHLFSALSIVKNYFHYPTPSQLSQRTLSNTLRLIGIKQGARIKSSLSKLKQQILPLGEGVENTYVRMVVDNTLVGNVFATK